MECEICYVTDRVVMEGQRIRYMYRVDPVNDADCGWRFSAGSKEPAFTESALDFRLYKLEMIIRSDPGVVVYLDLPVGSVLERIGQTDYFTLLN